MNKTQKKILNKVNSVSPDNPTVQTDDGTTVVLFGKDALRTFRAWSTNDDDDDRIFFSCGTETKGDDWDKTSTMTISSSLSTILMLARAS